MTRTIKPRLAVEWDPGDEGELFICHLNHSSVVVEIAPNEQDRLVLNLAWLPVDLVEHARSVVGMIDLLQFSWSNGQSVTVHDTQAYFHQLEGDLVRQMLSGADVTFPHQGDQFRLLPDIGSRIKVTLRRPSWSGYMEDVHPEERGDWEYSWTTGDTITDVRLIEPDGADHIVGSKQNRGLATMAPARV